MIPFNPAPLLFLTPCSSRSCFVEITQNLLHQPTYLHTARNTILSELSANPTRFQIIHIYHSRKSWLLLAILPVFRWDDKRKFSSWGKKQHCRVLGGVFFNRWLCTKYYWMAWLQTAEYSGPRKLAGKNALQQDAACGDETERRSFTSWQSWRNFWRSLLSFSLIRSSLAASRFFRCLVKKITEKTPWNRHFRQKCHLLGSAASLGHRYCRSTGCVPLSAFPPKAILEAQIRRCYFTCLLEFSICLFSWPAKYTGKMLKPAGLHECHGHHLARSFQDHGKVHTVCQKT